VRWGKVAVGDDVVIRLQQKVLAHFVMNRREIYSLQLDQHQT